MGCDYTTGHKQWLYKTAYWAIRNRESLEEIAPPLDLPVYQKARELLSGVYDTQESLMGEKQWEKWIGGSPPLELDALETLRETRLKTLAPGEFRILCDGLHEAYVEGG
jgi:hypothetical protein